MATYYIHNGTDREGPYTKDELRTKRIEPSTPVWQEGMTDWTEAKSIAELSDLFVIPPPYQSGRTASDPNRFREPLDPKPRTQNTSRRIALGVVLVLALVAGIAIYDQANEASRGASGTKSYEERVMTVEEIEHADPSRFLNASGTWNENFWGNNLKIHGTVTSTATVANFKDVVIQVTYYSETETVLGTDNYILYKFVPAHSKIEFEWTLDKPNACKRLGWDVIKATPA